MRSGAVDGSLVRDAPRQERARRSDKKGRREPAFKYWGD